MIEQDTIRLLRECDAGIKMGTSAIEDVIDHVCDKTLKKQLRDCKTTHEQLRAEIQTQLNRYGDSGKEANPIIKGLSHIKTCIKMRLDDSDQTIAALMTAGCDMGIKSLSQYLNQYKAADEASKDIAKRLIAAENHLAVNIRTFL